MEGLGRSGGWGLGEVERKVWGEAAWYGSHCMEGEVAGIEDGIRNCPRGPVWILSDSKAAIAAVANAGKMRRASTGSLANAVARMVYRIRRRRQGAVKLSWVKEHAGVVGNEEADKRAGWCTSRTGERSVTECSIWACGKAARRAERECEGFGMGRAVEWGRRALTNYTHARTGKGKLWYWRELVGQRDAGCRWYGASMKDGDHIAFHCRERAEGRRWASWVEVEDGDK